MRLKEIMNTNVETISPNHSAESAWEKMRAMRIRHLVVMDGKAVVGVVSERDLGGPKGGPMRKNRTVSELASDDIFFATPEMTIQQAANKMRGNTIGCLPVVDRERLVGILTISDLLDLIRRGIEKPVVKTKRWTLKHRGQGEHQARHIRSQLI